MSAVTDPKDVRVMVPPMRRALVGPFGSGFVNDTLNENDTAAIVADAIGDVILYAGSAFGKQLVVVDRDSYYQAPIAWATSEELAINEQRVVVAQGALTYLMRSLTSQKTSESIQRGDETWDYTVSAQAVSEWAKQLRAARDAAIERLEVGAGAVEAWVNTLAVRDAYTDMLIEPYVAGGIGGQLEIANPDYRFGTIDWLVG